MRIVLQPAASKPAQRHFADTVTSPVPQARLAEHLEQDDMKRIRAVYGDSDVPVWGVKPGKGDFNVPKWSQLERGDLVLFAGDWRVFKSAVVTITVRSRDLARDLWGKESGEQIWECIYLLDDVTDRDVSLAVLNAAAGYKPKARVQRFNLLNQGKSDAIVVALGLDDVPSRRITLLTDPAAVEKAIDEYEALGQDAFLARYGFGRSKTYVLEVGGKPYDSKAIAGVAFGYQHGAPLRPDEFSGGAGEGAAATVLRRLGFSVAVITGEADDGEEVLTPPPGAPPRQPGLRMVGAPSVKDLKVAKKGSKRGPRKTDHLKRQRASAETGAAGELAAMVYETQRLEEAGRPDLAARVKRMSEVDDGAGYDLASFEEDGTPIFIEVKSTTRGQREPFFISSGEWEFMEANRARYRLYRVFDLDRASTSGTFFPMNAKQVKALHRRATEYELRWS